MSSTETPARAAAGLWRQVQGFADSLAGRLLALTVLAVIVGEVLIFVPALADFHETWLTRTDQPGPDRRAGAGGFP